MYRLRSGAAAWACGTGAGGGAGEAAAGLGGIWRVGAAAGLTATASPPAIEVPDWCCGWTFGAADRAAGGGRGCEALGARVFCLACELGRLVDPLPVVA